MRVIAGELKGRRIRAPKGARVRPTADRVREAVFSILGDLTGVRVLDLFAGTGALAIEALSRGAASATLVDADLAPARRNVSDLGLDERADLVCADAISFLRRPSAGPFDLVFCDPPYKLADRLADQLDSSLPTLLAPGARLVTESGAGRSIELSLPLLTERRYGDTLVRVHSAGGPAS